MDKNIKKDCILCSNQDQEAIAIINEVQLKLYQVKKKSDINHDNDSEMSKNSQGFYRLIRIIFSNKLKHSKSSLSCRHEQIKRRFIKNLKCPLNMLNILCDELSSILGKFNFHVDILIQQIKGFQRYLRSDKDKGQNQNQTPLIKQQHQQIIQRTSEISESKSENEKVLEKLKAKKQNSRQQDSILHNMSVAAIPDKGISQQPLQDKANQMNFLTMSTNMNMTSSPMPNLFYPGMNMNMMWYYQNQGNM